MKKILAIRKSSRELSELKGKFLCALAQETPASKTISQVELNYRGTEHVQTDCQFKLRIHTVFGDLWLTDASLVHAISGVAIDLTWSADALSGWLRVAESSVESAVAEALGGPVKLFEEAGPPCHELVALEIRFHTRSEVGRTYAFPVHANVDTARAWALATFWSPLSSKHSREYLAQLPCIGRLAVGATHLTSQELALLKPGDAIVLTQRYGQGNSFSRVHFGPCAAEICEMTDHTIGLRSLPPSGVTHVA